jgi:hypothetical protein
MATGADVVAALEKLLGDRYVYGAAGPSTFDCSGLAQFAYGKVGIKLPRVSSEQYNAGKTITHDQLQPGDLVFSEWQGDDVAHHGHVAIYVGGGQIIEAPHPGGVVQKVALDSNYLAHVDGYTRPNGLTSAGTTGGTSAVPIDSATGTDASFWGRLWDLFGPDSLKPGHGAGAIAGQATQALGDVINFFAAFFRPSTYIRIGAGFFGFIFLIFGLVFLMREASNA